MAETTDDIARWLPEARAGSAEALGQVLEACRGYLLLVAVREIDPGLQAKGGASDLVQETFLEAQRDFARFQGATEAELLAWLRRVLLNNVAKFTRHYRETNKRRVDQEVALQGGGSNNLAAGLAGPHPSPSNEAIAREQDEQLRHALQRLPEDYRRVIRLHFQEQRSFEEIAAEMQRSLAAVRKLWARAVERLQQELDTPP